MIDADKATIIKVGQKYFFDTEAESKIKSIVHSVVEEAQAIKKRIQKLPPSLRGTELLRIFILDLLGRTTPAAKIIKYRLYLDVDHYVVAWWMKALAATAIFLLNCYLIFTVILYGFSKGIEWQKSWLISTLINFAITYLFNELAQAFFIEFVIPEIVTSQIFRAQEKMFAISNKLFSKKKFSFGSQGKSNASSSEKEKEKEDKEDEEVSADGGAFSSTDYMFVSTMVAKYFPELTESAFILSYRTHLPNEFSWNYQLIHSNHHHQQQQQQQQTNCPEPHFPPD